MCVTLILAGIAVATAAVGTAATISSANANAANAKYQAQVQAKQADEQRDTAQIQALQSENARTAEFNKARSASLAAIGASGLGEQISYFNGLEPDSQSAYLRDVRNIRLNLTQTKSTLADQVQVSDFGATIAKKNASAQTIGAFASFAQTAMSAGSFYNSAAVPTPKGG